MALDHYTRKGTKSLRYGYTTGTCAALAAAAATRMLLGGEPVDSVSLLTPKGIEVEVPVEEKSMDVDGGPGGTGGVSAWAGIPKDAGDDADITDGMLICARAEKFETKPGEISVTIDGGEGVGRVTREGLDQPVGNAAINSGPRKMIEEQVTKVCQGASYEGGIAITVFVPGGEEAAKQTFNSNLGIEGGLSILGTTGIVEPMSEQALVDTIELEMKQNALKSDCLVLTPGNYGIHYIEEQGLDKLVDDNENSIPVLKFSNFLGETLDMLSYCGIKKVLLVAHAGKLVKVAGGIMNTHSSWADCRNEIVCAHSAICGADRDTCEEIMEAATADACFDILKNKELLDPVISGIMKAIQQKLEHRLKGKAEIGAIMFSNVHGTLGHTKEADKLLDSWKR